MPTSASTTYAGTKVDPVFNADDAYGSMISVALKASTTYAAGTVLGEVTATPGTYGPYASGNSDGTQTARVILQYAAVTDSSGNITGSNEWGFNSLTAACYTQGQFRTADLTGLDANAVTNLAGHLSEGSVTTGILTF